MNQIILFKARIPHSEDSGVPTRMDIIIIENLKEV